MRSISSGGQPCSVDSVIERDTRELMPRIYASSTFRNRPTFARAHSTHALKASVSLASIMPLMKASIFSERMPLRS